MIVKKEIDSSEYKFWEFDNYIIGDWAYCLGEAKGGLPHFVRNDGVEDAN